MTSDNPLAYLHRRCDTVAEDNARARCLAQRLTGGANSCPKGYCNSGRECDCDHVLHSEMPAAEPRLWDPSASNAVHAFKPRRKRRQWREVAAVFAVLFLAFVAAFEFIKSQVL